MTCGKIPFGLLYTTFKLLKKVNVSSWCHLIELFISFKILSQGSHPIVLIIFYCSYAKFVSELSGFACKKLFTFPTSDIMQLDCFSIFHFSPHYILHLHLPSSLKSGITSSLIGLSQLKVYIVILPPHPVICEVIFLRVNFLPLTLFDLSLWPPCHL